MKITCTCMVILLAVCSGIYGKDLRIGAFNIQVFGETKSSKPDVMDILVKIIRRYDLIFIQEIRDAKNQAIHKLLDQVNIGQSKPFQMILSPRLGRTKSKEQYAYFYRPDSGLRVNEYYTYDDGLETLGTDLFEREPFIISLSSDNTELSKFGLAGIHVDPDVAVNEINHLQSVFSNMKTRLRTNDVMVMGDLNADCSYLPKKYWPMIEVKSNPAFHWWIGDDVDTTVKRTHCAYDRFISTGRGWTDGIVPGSAGVYKFDEDISYIGVINETMAAAVSDHYPIEFLLEGKQNNVMKVFDVFISLTMETGSLTVGSTYDVSSDLGIYEHGVLKGIVILPDELKIVLNHGISMSIEPQKNRYNGVQRSILTISMSTSKIYTWNVLIDVCEVYDLRCQISR